MRRAKPIADLNSLPIEEACKRLREGLEAVFYPNEQCIDLLILFIESAYAHARLVYADERMFLEAIYSGLPPLPQFSQPIILTGHSGIGKSALIAALHLLFSQALNHRCGDTTWHLKASWEFALNAVASIKDLLLTVVKSESLSDMLKSARRNAYRDGICFMSLDEQQFASLSSNANARLTQMLFAAAYLGLPWVAALNFSAVRKLMKRPPEDQQRLLSHPIVMLPDLPDGDDWSNMVALQFEVAPEIFSSALAREAPLIHGLCAGQKRAEIDLLVHAYRIARQSRSSAQAAIEISDLEAAYRSPAYTVHRIEIDEIHNRAITGEAKADSLSCPIPISRDLLLETKARLVAQRQAVVAGAELKDALTAAEKMGARTIAREARRKECQKGQSSAHTTKGKVTLDELQENATWFSNGL